MSERLEYLAQRAAADPFYLAAPLAAYARSEGLDDAALAAHLGCSPETLTLLRLCRRPRADGFGADVVRVAERFGIDPLPLAEMVRRADALDALREGGGAGEKGALIAARDRGPGSTRRQGDTEREYGEGGYGETADQPIQRGAAARDARIVAEPGPEDEVTRGGLEGRAAPKRDGGEREE